MSRTSEDYYRGSYAITLRGFYWAAKLLSFSRAADELGVEESTISLQIRALERDLNATLFERRGRAGVQLTDDGRQLLELAIPIVAGIENLAQDFKARRQQTAAGSVGVAVGELTSCYLPSIISRCQELYPEVRIDAIQKSGKDVFSALRQHEIDFAFTIARLVPGWVACIEYIRSPFCIMTSHEHPLASIPQLTAHDVSKYRIVIANQPDPSYVSLREAFSVHGASLSFVPGAVGSFSTVARCVERGLGIAVVSEVCAKELLRGFQINLIPAADLFGYQYYGIMYLQGHHLSCAARTVMQLIWKLKPDLVDHPDDSESSG